MAEKISKPRSGYSVATASGPIGQRVATLQRQASKYQGKNLSAALECLQSAAELMRQHPSDYPLDRWLRLPLLLQQAGCFDACVMEFHLLLDETQERVKNQCSRQKEEIVQKFVHLNYFQIYEKMSLACKRQKLINQATQYTLLADEHYQEFLNKSVDSCFYRQSRPRYQLKGF